MRLSSAAGLVAILAPTTFAYSQVGYQHRQCKSHSGHYAGGYSTPSIASPDASSAGYGQSNSASAYPKWTTTSGRYNYNDSIATTSSSETTTSTTATLDITSTIVTTSTLNTTTTSTTTSTTTTTATPTTTTTSTATTTTNVGTTTISEIATVTETSTDIVTLTRTDSTTITVTGTTDTLTSVQTSTLTNTDTITSSITDTVIETETTTTTTTTTITTPEGFLPVISTLPGSSSPPDSKKRDTAQIANHKINLRQASCEVEGSCSTITTTITTTTTTIARLTKTDTETTTITSIVNPSATTTTTTTVTVTESTTTNPVTTTTVTTTSVSIVAVPTYDACASNNQASRILGATINGGSSPGSSGDYVAIAVSTAYDCCVEAISYPNSSVYLFNTYRKACYIYTSRTCVPVDQSTTWYAARSTNGLGYYIIGNSVCAAWRDFT